MFKHKKEIITVELFNEKLMKIEQDIKDNYQKKLKNKKNIKILEDYSRARKLKEEKDLETNMLIIKNFNE